MDEPRDLDAAKAAPPDASRAAPDSARRGAAIAKLVVVLALLTTGLVVLLGSDSIFVYSIDVAAVMGDPGAHRDRTLRVEGALQPGSIQFREEPCEWRFALEEDHQVMPVRFAECSVPDTFRDGMGITVVVQGQLHSDGHFEASEVIPRCPSKYEMQERLEDGEAMPHPMPAGAPGPSVPAS